MVSFVIKALYFVFNVCDSRLGNLSCLADPEDLLMYKDSEAFGVIQSILLNCTRAKRSLPSRLVGTENIFTASCFDD